MLTFRFLQNMYILQPPYEKSIHKGVNEVYAPVNVPSSDSESFGSSEEEGVSTVHQEAWAGRQWAEMALVVTRRRVVGTQVSPELHPEQSVALSALGRKKAEGPHFQL